MDIQVQMQMDIINRGRQVQMQMDTINRGRQGLKTWSIVLAAFIVPQLGLEN